MWSSTLYYLADPNLPIKPLFSANEHDPELAGLGPNDIGEFYFQGHAAKVSIQPKYWYDVLLI